MYIEESKEFQKTIKNIIHFEGKGAHSGKFANLTLKPAKENSGIIFIRTDISDIENQIILSPENLGTVKGGMCTMLKNKSGTIVKTPEHLLSSIWGADIDNLIIEIDNEEVPILDGSALEYLNALNNCGTVTQNSYRKYLIIDEEYEFKLEDSVTKITPFNGFKVEAEINFKNDLGQEIFKNSYSYDSNMNFKEHVGYAHTFALKSWEKYKKMGIAGLGADEENTIIINDINNIGEVHNPKILRNNNYAEECAAHKVLDLIGDYMALGIRMKAHVKAHLPGHFVNANTIKAISKFLQTKKSSNIIEFLHTDKPMKKSTEYFKAI